jgi:hypothetical protein
LHPPERLPAAEEGGAQGAAQLEVPLLPGQLGQRLLDQPGGVVDQGVEALQRREGGLDLGLVGGVDARPPADPDYLIAPLAELRRDRPAQTAGSAGDDRDRLQRSASS